VKNFRIGQQADATDVVALDLVNAGKNAWWAHPDERVDVAVIPVSAAHLEELLQNDVHFIPVADFATKAETENYKVGIVVSERATGCTGVMSLPMVVGVAKLK
jgi:hypothetical protein